MTCGSRNSSTTSATTTRSPRETSRSRSRSRRPPARGGPAIGSSASAWRAAASNAQQAVRQLSDEIKSEQGWLDQLCEADAAEIHPNPIVITKAGRERMAGARAAKYDEHAARKKRLENRLADATKVADEARAGLVAAEVRVATIRKKILAI